MRLLIIDNYDSFTYNLVQYCKALYPDYSIDVYRNDVITLSCIRDYDALILSPGPGLPTEAGLLMDIIQCYAATKPILGVCLGHQAIGVSFGAQLQHLTKVYHGVATTIQLESNEHPLFTDMEPPIEVGRYHSWIVSEENFPTELEIIARDEQGAIMALAHQTYPVMGVQFHPESVLTPKGKQLIQNFLTLATKFTTV